MNDQAGTYATITILALTIWLVAKPRSYGLSHWSPPAWLSRPRPKIQSFSDLELAMFVVGLQTQVAAGASLAVALANQVLEYPANFPKTNVAVSNQLDFVEAFTEDSRLQKQRIFSGLATLLNLAQQTGASVDSALAHLANQELMARDEQRLLESELAATRATVKVLTALPVFGLAMVSLIDFEVLHWLFSTGRLVLLSGLLLIGLGFLWLNRIVQKALR